MGLDFLLCAKFSWLELSLSSWQKLALLNGHLTHWFPEVSKTMPWKFLIFPLLWLPSCCQATSSGEDDLCVRNSLWAHLPSPDPQWECQHPPAPAASHIQLRLNLTVKRFLKAQRPEKQLRLLLEVFILRDHERPCWFPGSLCSVWLSAPFLPIGGIPRPNQKSCS